MTRKDWAIIGLLTWLAFTEDMVALASSVSPLVALVVKMSILAAGLTLNCLRTLGSTPADAMPPLPNFMQRRPPPAG